MKNPWAELPLRQPYVLPKDKPVVEAFNEHYIGGHERFRLDLCLLPHPFLGTRDAPLVILNRNPGRGADSEIEGRGARGKAMLAYLRSDLKDQVHLGFAPEFDKTGLGKWWRRAFSAVVDEGFDLGEIAQRVLAIEFHGYHSKSFRPLPVTLHSQGFGFGLVEEAMERAATIVLMRGERAWSVAVPGLRGYSRLIRARNPRSSSISPGNLQRSEDFGEILRALRRAPRRSGQ